MEIQLGVKCDLYTVAIYLMLNSAPQKTCDTCPTWLMTLIAEIGKPMLA
jgi:hypothetical protein